MPGNENRIAVPERLNSSKTEFRRNEKTKISSVVSFWGDEYDSETLRKGLSEKVGFDISSTGFEKLYRTSPNLTAEEAVEQEKEVASSSIKKLLIMSRWSPKTVGCIAVGSGSPPMEDYADFIKNATGMKIADPLNTYAACNSAGRVLQRVLENNDNLHRRVVVAGMEGLTRLMPELDLENADPFSLSVFGNGFAAVSFVPGENLRYITGNHIYEQDTEGKLAAKTLYTMDEGKFYQVSGHTEKVRNPIPTKGTILMNQLGTTKQFLRLGGMTLDALMDDYDGIRYRGKVDDKPIKLVVAHHPSKKLFDALSERIVKNMRSRGLSIPEIPWRVNESNSSAATSMIAFARTIEELDPGDRFIYLSYGAGMSASGMIIDVGAA